MIYVIIYKLLNYIQADELDLHHKNPVGDCEQNLMLSYDLSWSPTMSIAGHPE